MTDAAETLSSLVGSPIVRVVVQVLFYGVERLGAWGDMFLVFGNGRVVAFGCAGDGTILVSEVPEPARCAPPHTTIDLRELAGLSGQMDGFDEKGSRLTLAFQGGTLELVNEDDELLFRIDGAEPLAELLHRAVQGESDRARS
ncbi:MAG: hypothetical protein IT175_01070 [Acidobacteria bacterium]|nr:hypothetical protein [Acidobacteriota bacterium]